LKDTLEVRNGVIEACRWLLDQGFVCGTWGNISVRLEDGSILITPSRIAYDAMLPEDLVVLSPEGTALKGHRLATSERELHRLILNRRGDIRAIIHTHSTYALAAGALGRPVPPLSEEMCQLLGGEIPVTARFVPSEKHLELGEMAASCIGNANALLIRNHGVVCCGRDLEEAKVCAQIAEKSCQIYLHLLGRQFSPVEEPWVGAGRDYYLYSYGKT
jgi:L-fuculose-phosphate aldolase